MKRRPFRLRRPTVYRRPIRGAGGLSHYPFTITGFNPTAVLVGSGNTPVHVLGGAFPIGSNVYVNGVLRATTYESASSLLITITAAEAASQALYSIQVRTSTQASNAVFFPVAIATPTLATSNPAFGYRGEGNVPVAITGTGIYPSTTATANGAPIAFTFGSTTTGTITIPSATAIGDYDLALVNAPPGGGPSNSRLFQMRLRAPVVSSVSATSLVIGRPNAFTITGPASPATFYAETTVEVDGVAIPATVNSGSLISFSFPPAIAEAPGLKSIVVRNPTAGGGGGVSAAQSFEIIAFPTFITIDITEVVQYFDGFPAKAQFDRVDSLFVLTYNNVAQPSTFVDPQTITVNVTSAACAVPGTTMVRARDTVSGLSTNAIPFVVSPWDPLKIGPALRWWLNGTSLVDDGTGRVSQWQDLSGGGRHISQATAGNRPLIVSASASLNGQPAARFSSARPDILNSGVSWLGTGAAGIITKQSYNAWVAGFSTSAGNNQIVIADSAGSVAVGRTTTPSSISTLDDSAGSVFASAAFAYAGGAPFAFRARKDATSRIYARVARGAEVSALVTGPVTAFVPANVLVGFTWQGDIGEIIVCNAELNYTFKAMIDNMLSFKYGLPFSAPGTAPAVTSVVPNTATQLDLPFVFDVFDTGNSFTPTAIINVFELPLPTTYIGPGQLRARLPQAALLTAGGRAITVADAGGISGPKGISVVPYAPLPGPNIFSLTPGAGQQYGSPIPGVVVEGVNFSPAAVLYANAIPCPTVVDSPTQLTCTIPKEALYTNPGPVMTVHDGAAVSNPLEFTTIPWSPANLTGVTSWGRADDVTLGTGSAVAQMNDKTGNGRHYKQVAAAKQPLLVASDARFNGAPSLDFDGADDYMLGPAETAAFSATCMIYAVVYRADAITGTGPITTPQQNNTIVGNADAVNGSIVMSLKNTPEMYCAVFSAAWRVASNPNAAALVAQQAIAVCDATTITASINGIAGAPLTYPGLVNSATLISLGGGQGFATPGYLLNGQIAEIVTCNAPWTALDNVCWRNYCAHRYGTP